MEQDRWEKVRTIFHKAAEMGPDRRGSYLDRECEGDQDLRAEVERLLAADEGTETFFVGKRRRVLPDDHLVAGRLRVVRFVGAGGMGEVYEAQDLELGERVAVKVLRPELQIDSHFIDRFRREVQIARRITHRNICRIFDVGRDRVDDHELTYFTMEYLEGETLGAYLKRLGPAIRRERPAARPPDGRGPDGPP